MLNVPITNVPIQNLQIQLDDNYYDITIRLCAAQGFVAAQVAPFYDAPIMAVDIFRNDLVIITGQRVVSNYPLIPYRYLEDGNFVFITQNEELPDWTQFGITQSLVYASASELAALRAGV